MQKHPRIEKIRFDRWQLRKAILEVVVLSLLSGGGHPLRPILPLMIKEIVRLVKEMHKLDIEEKKITRVLKNLEKRDILFLERKGKTLYVHSINNEKPAVAKYSIKLLLDFKKKKKEWNGKWFMVFFDVPEIQRSKRNYLRKFLEQIGFYRYQKSVYIFPYECEKEIALIKKIVAGAKYMKYIIAEKVEDEATIKRFFKL
jgi:CRISPR-associated endonuclease Cas2